MITLNIEGNPRNPKELPDIFGLIKGKLTPEITEIHVHPRMRTCMDLQSIWTYNCLLRVGSYMGELMMMLFDRAIIVVSHMPDSEIRLVAA